MVRAVNIDPATMRRKCESHMASLCRSAVFCVRFGCMLINCASFFGRCVHHGLPLSRYGGIRRTYGQSLFPFRPPAPVRERELYGAGAAVGTDADCRSTSNA